MRIERALFCAGVSSFFFDDQRAIKGGADQDGFIYSGQPVTPGFTAIRQAGECICVMLVTDTGEIGRGDCAAVQYSGAGGRDPLFVADAYLPILHSAVRPALEGMRVDTFREACDYIETLEADGKPLHRAMQYGLTQAVLDAKAQHGKKLKTEVLCEEYDLPLTAERVPVFGQTGDDRYVGVDKMILKEVDVLPHGLLNSVKDKVGRNGEKLADYIRWVAQRIRSVRLRPDYVPALHFDVYGTLGLIFDDDPGRIADYLASLEEHAQGHALYIEGPVDAEEKPRQIHNLKRIKDLLEQKGSPVKIVADEWCNTREDIIDFADAACCHMLQIKTPDLGGIHNIVESVLYCKRSGLEAYQGGTCNETDVSAATCVHLAMAARPDRILAKPGMGFDEGYTIVNNEMQRISQVLRCKSETGHG